MNGKQLIELFRQRTDDLAKPYLWSDDEILAYLSEAEKDAAERAKLIRDSTTPTVSRIVIRAGIAEYKLHPLVTEIIRAKIKSQSHPLSQTTVEELDNEVPAWDALSGTPSHFIDNERTIRIFPKPATDDVLEITAFRLPIDPITKDSYPEIHASTHFHLVDGAMRLAYLKPDSDAFDEKKAEAAEIRFAMKFGQRIDANVRRKQRDKSPCVVKYRI